MKKTFYILHLLFALLVVLSCGSPQQAESGFPSDVLPVEIDSLGLVRSSEIRVFVGDSLWEYINGGAELYHLYNFVQVATADYRQDGIELVVDVYQFDTPENAFGLYTMLRPEMIQTIALGVDAFDSPTNLIMVKGPYVAAITAFEQGDRVSQAISTTAGLLNNLLSGTTERPSTFALFPAPNAVAATEVIYAESFMGQGFLTDVYSRKYAADVDTLQLFIADDGSGEKYLGWKEQVDAETSTKGPLDDMAFDEGLSFRFTHSYYGEIVAGLKSGRLVGVVGYQDGMEDFVTGWVNSLPPSAP